MLRSASRGIGYDPVFHIVLHQPEIPPNTGNVIRLCANTGCQLHLIHPLGFELDDRRLRRAGLDYQEWASLREHADIESFLTAVAPQRVFALSTRGTRFYAEALYAAGDAFLFGSETRGLSRSILTSLKKDHVLRIPMLPGNRSLNLSNAVAVVVYEGWRQLAFANAAV
jgi:tRNA (cytidine/uridine-2'-O-)-methyltransferase